MATPYQLFGTACLRGEKIEDGPGEVVVILQEPYVLRRSHGAVVVRLKPGDVLYAASDVDSLRETVAQHLSGPFYESDLRFGVGLIAGHLPPHDSNFAAGVQIESGINAWLDANTAFAISVQPQPPRYLRAKHVGVLNGILAKWREKASTLTRH